MKVIVVGAGWGGVSAAYEAAKLGAEVKLIERTDMLLGTGLVGGIMRNNGRFTGLEEMKVMGISEFITEIDGCSKHINIDFPGHKHANLYDVTKIEKVITDLLVKNNIDIIYNTRIIKVHLNGKKIIKVISDQGVEIIGDVFIDATGTAGPMNNCSKYGNGCAMCVLRCPSFNGRVSLTALCGIKEIEGKRKDATIGSMSGSCKIIKNTLSQNIVDELNNKGLYIAPLNKEFIEDHLDLKACQQYALKEYKDNLILLDTGEAKLMTPYYPLVKLRKINGFENARYLDPYTGGKGNSMRFFAIAPHENTLKVKDIDNLLCAGEKTGLVGHTEAIITGILAGYNAVNNMIEFPRSTVAGECIAYTNEQLQTEEGLSKKYTISGSILFNRIRELGLYTIDIVEINDRITKLGLINIFD